MSLHKTKVGSFKVGTTIPTTACRLLSSNTMDLTLQDKMSSLVEISTSQERDVFIHADFSIAKYIQEGLTHFFNNFDISYACENSMVMLVVSFSKERLRSAVSPVC